MNSTLNSYNTTQQQYGDFFAGYPWTVFGTGTFRKKISFEQAPSRMKRFMRDLGISVRAVIPYVGVLEQRLSGLGFTEIPLHFHFLAACPPRCATTFHSTAGELWSKTLGNSKVVPYDPALPGAYYMAKLAGLHNFEFVLDNMDRLPYLGSDDPILASQQNPYVPKHAKGGFRLNTLVVRDGITRLPIESDN